MRLTGLDLLPSDLGFTVPGDNWRPDQLEIAEQLLNSTKRYLFLQAATGAGKSVINQIPGKWLNQRTLILTRTIQLQDQYGEQGVQVLYGRNRYMCDRLALFDPSATAADGICQAGIYCAMMWDGSCDYYAEKYQAVNADAACLNYAYFFRETSHGKGRFTGYDWLVLDEGHAVPNELTSAVTINLKFADLTRLGIPPSMINTVAGWKGWANHRSIGLKRRVESNQLDRARSAATRKLLLTLEALDCIANPEDWFITIDDLGVELKPIWPTALASQGVWSHANKFILSSATIEPTYFASMMGLDIADIDVINPGSSFPTALRPIFVRPHHRVSRRSTDEDLLELVRAIDKLIASYNGRGLIHTGNYATSLFIAQHTIHHDRVLYHDAENRLSVLDRFKDKGSERKVLLSPSMTEGVDLPYELCVFQIIAKMPFANMGDPLWQARFNSDLARGMFAYNGEAISSVVQACGRGMRAHDDYCDTYILDRSFSRLKAENDYRFPKFFTEALQYI
jgi:ATP-dependent DNA helicase DinG